MKLDKRIIDRQYIFDCFNADKAREFIGEDCFMTNDIELFKNLDSINVYKLDKIEDGFYDEEEDEYFDFCLPVRFSQPKEKQYRPFTLNEFLHIYELGDIVTFRCKYNDHRYAGIVTGYETDKEGDKAIIHIGCYSYLLSVLFTDYERINSEEGEWVPFGIEVEE